MFHGNATDVYGGFIPFGFQSLYVWFIADSDVWVDYSLNNINPVEVYKSTRQHLIMLSAYGFRVINNIAGSNTPYQLVVWR